MDDDGCIQGKQGGNHRKQGGNHRKQGGKP